MLKVFLFTVSNTTFDWRWGATYILCKQTSISQFWSTSDSSQYPFRIFCSIYWKLIRFFIKASNIVSWLSLIYVLDAYEFYMFHLAYHLVNTRVQNHNCNWNNITDTLYPVLVDDYLNYFLPLNRDSLPKMPIVQAPVRSPVVHSPVAGYVNQGGHLRLPGWAWQDIPNGVFSYYVSAMNKYFVPTLKGTFLLNYVMKFY